MSDTQKKDKRIDIRHTTPLSVRDSSTLLFVYRKAERLTAAVHMVTNFMSDDEPLRRELRNQSIAILSGLLETQTSSGRGGILDDLSIKIFEVLSLLGVAHLSGLMSDMNHSVLQQEYDAILQILESKKDTIDANERKLNKGFFDVGDQSTSSLQQSKGDDDVRIGKPSGMKGKTGSLKDTAPLEPGGKVSIQRASTAQKSRDRRNIILKLIQTSGYISVRDAANLIEGYSEKTIQRELLAMVSEGVLRKEGERRWSIYKLAT